MTAHAQRLHVTLLARFLYDCLHFQGSLLAAPAGSATTAAAPPARAKASPRGPAPRAAGATSPARADPAATESGTAPLPVLVRFDLRDSRVDLPRRSDGSDYLSLAVASADVVAPASAAHLAATAPDMEE